MAICISDQKGAVFWQALLNTPPLPGSSLPVKPTRMVLLEGLWEAVRSVIVQQDKNPTTVQSGEGRHRA